MKRFSILLTIVVLFAAGGCGNEDPVTRTKAKISFDLDQLDENGLRGPADGKVALSYEFCIPNDDQKKKAVRQIDPSVRFMPGSKGRIGAKKGECLCIGNTHQRDAIRILKKLSELPYVEKIDECFFE